MYMCCKGALAKHIHFFAGLIWPSGLLKKPCDAGKRFVKNKLVLKTSCGAEKRFVEKEINSQICGARKRISWKMRLWPLRVGRRICWPMNPFTCRLQICGDRNRMCWKKRFTNFDGPKANLLNKADFRNCGVEKRICCNNSLTSKLNNGCLEAICLGSCVGAFGPSLDILVLVLSGLAMHVVCVVLYSLACPSSHFALHICDR